MFDAVVSLLKTWVGNGANTNWTTAANWQDNSVPANDTTTNTAVFASASSYTRQPNGFSQSIKGLIFSGAADVTFGAGSLTVGTGGITVSSGAGVVSLSGITVSGTQLWDVASGKTITHSAGFNGSGTIQKTGAGAHTVGAGNSSFSGQYQLLAGTLNLGTASATAGVLWGTQNLQLYGGVLDNTSGAQFTNASSIDILGDFTYGTSGGVSTTNNLTLNASGSTISGTRTITCPGGGVFSVASISGGGSLVKAGTGILTLAGTTTYSGTTTINAGTVRVSNHTGGGTCTISGGTLTGNTTSGTYTASITVSGTAGSTLEALTGFFNTGAVTFTNSSSILKVITNGTTGCGRVVSSGVVALNGVTVNFDATGLNAGTYTVMSATSFTGTATKGTAPPGRTWTSLTVVGTILRAVLA